MAEQKLRRTRADKSIQRTVIIDEGKVYGPELPDDVLPAEQTWHPQTLAWWDSVRRFPLMKNETAFGWNFLIDTALMHHTMWTKGRWEFAGEIRIRLAKYGVTPGDRLTLKIQLEPKDDVIDKQQHELIGEFDQREAELTGENVRSIAARRKRLA